MHHTSNGKPCLTRWGATQASGRREFPVKVERRLIEKASRHVLSGIYPSGAMVGGALCRRGPPEGPRDGRARVPEQTVTKTGNVKTDVKTSALRALPVR